MRLLCVSIPRLLWNRWTGLVFIKQSTGKKMHSLKIPNFCHSSFNASQRGLCDTMETIEKLLIR